MVSFDIQGVAAPVFTPFHDDGKLNLAVIPEYMSYLIENGIRTILVGGTTGEAVTLNLEERKQVLEAWVHVAKPQGVKVIAQVGGVPLPDVLALAKHAEENSADAIMTLPELYYKPRTVEVLVSYLEAVSKAAPSLPLLYYHFPMMSGVDVNIPKFFSAATSKIPNFKGMKADLGVAVQVTDMLQGDQRIFIGNHMISPAVLLGHESSIATVTNIFPLTMQDIVRATLSGDVTTVRQLQATLNRILSSATSMGEFLPSMKETMTIMTGIAVGPPRHPIARLTDEEKKNLADNLSKFNISSVIN